MGLSRKEFLRLGLAGGVGLLLPFGVSGCGGLTAGNNSAEGSAGALLESASSISERARRCSSILWSSGARVSVMADLRTNGSYAGLVPRGLDAFEPDDRCWTYGRIRLRVFGHSDGTIDATWAFGQDTSVISERTHQDEGNAYARLGEVLARLERKEEARAAYERGTSQAGKFGHSVMADDLGLALIGLNE